MAKKILKSVKKSTRASRNQTPTAKSREPKVKEMQLRLVDAGVEDVPALWSGHKLSHAGYGRFRLEQFVGGKWQKLEAPLSELVSPVGTATPIIKA